MARQRAYAEHEVVETAKQLFCQHGLGRTTISDIEGATGLSRSSLYLAFETKRGLFDASLVDYVDSFIQPLLGPMEAPGAGPEQAAAFFRTLARRFRAPAAQHGCLMVNSIGELAGRDATFAHVASGYVSRLQSTFAHALRGVMSRGDVTRRSQMLASATLGAWIAVRVDPRVAATMCSSVAAEITGWPSVVQRA